MANLSRRHGTIPPVTRPSDELEQLRQWRTWPDRDVAVGDLVQALARRARRTEERFGAFVELWEALVPSELVGRTRLTAIRGAVAHVSVESASAAYELDRHLRGGLEAEIRKRYPATLTRIKVSVGVSA